ncbi:MAG: hypothetical protein Q4E60_03355 [Bacteroidales bacterium]|nr:hypothetical protein [Bacteroidales bacterium]
MGKKLLWKVLPVAFLAGVGSTAFTSCADEYDPAKITREDILKENYAKNWEEVFGTPDPNQDWSMAQPVTATISVPSVNDATLRVMTKSPMNRNCYLLSRRKVDGNMLNLQFDVVKGTKNVYVELKDANGRYLIDGYFPIENGKVIVDKNFASTRGTNLSPVTVAKYTPSSSYAGDGEGTVGWAGVSNKTGSSSLVPYPIEWFDESADKYHDAGWGYDLYNTTNINNKGATSIGNFYLISDMDLSDRTDPWMLKEMYPLYFYYTSTEDGTQKSGPFLEGQNNVIKYFSKTAQADEYPLEKDAHFITEGGPVELALYGKGTECPNDVGYFYYPKAQESEYMRADGTLDFDKVKKFVMLKNMSNTSHNLMMGTNLYNFSMVSSYNTGDFQTGVKWAYTGKNNDGVPYPEFENMAATSAKIKLTYFGDGDPETATPDYDFPADYVIGFFGIRTDVGISSNKHIYCSYASVELNYFNDYPRGAAFKYKGNVYLGIEDDTDYDHNDYLFRVTGVDGSRITDVTPEDDPDYVPEPDAQTWTVACEDLGGYYDYDFNDLVFGLRLTDNDDNTTKKLELIPLAAGGTLEAHVYYNGTDKGEIHNLVLPGAGFTTALNVGAGSNPGAGTAVTLDESTTDDINAVMAKVSIKVIKNGSDTANNSYNIGFDYEKGNEAKKAPQVLLLPAGWDWPSEDTFICYVYSKFAAWTQNADVTDWCNDRDGQGGYVNSPFTPVTPSNPGQDPSDPVTPPSKSACNLNIVQNVEIILPSDGGTGTVVDHYTTSSTGAVSAVSSSDKVTVVVDQVNKTITLSATEVVSDVTVTVTQEADANYEAGTKTITVKSVAGITEYKAEDLDENWDLSSRLFTSTTEVVITVYTSEETYIQGVVGHNYHAYNKGEGNTYSFTYNSTSNPSLSDLKSSGVYQNANKDKITKIVVHNK